LKVGTLELLQLRNKNRSTLPPFWNRSHPFSQKLHREKSLTARAVAVALWATHRTRVVEA